MPTAEMPTATLTPAGPAASPSAPPLRRYELSTTGSAEALMRVIGLIRRRCGEVVALEFRSGDRHRPPMLEVAVAIDRDRGRTLALRLAALIEVTGVREV
jgi:hypothetical protein